MYVLKVQIFKNVITPLFLRIIYIHMNVHKYNRKILDEIGKALCFEITATDMKQGLRAMKLNSLCT